MYCTCSKETHNGETLSKDWGPKPHSNCSPLDAKWAATIPLNTARHSAVPASRITGANVQANMHPTNHKPLVDLRHSIIKNTEMSTPYSSNTDLLASQAAFQLTCTQTQRVAGMQHACLVQITPGVACAHPACNPQCSSVMHIASHNIMLLPVLQAL